MRIKRTHIFVNTLIKNAQLYRVLCIWPRVSWGVEPSEAELIPLFPLTLIPHFPWDFPDPVIPSNSSLHFPVTRLHLSIFYLVIQNQYWEILISSFPQADPRYHLSPTRGFCSWWTDRLTTVCILPSDASSSSPSENREIQYELLSLLQGQAERLWEREREGKREMGRDK